MVTVLPQEKGYGDYAREAIEGFTQGYQNRHDEMALQKAIKDLPPDATPRQRLDTILGVKTYNPKAKQEVFKNILGAEQFEETRRANQQNEEIRKAQNIINQNKLNKDQTKATQDRQAVRSIVSKLDIPEDQKEVFAETLTLPAVEGLLKQQLKPVKEDQVKQSPFDKKVEEAQAEDYMNLTKEIPKLKDQLNTIDYVEKLSGDLGYLGGLTAPLSGVFGTEKARELEATSFPLIESIVKIFNPSGPIATQKLKIIQDKYQIKATDFPWQTQGKIKAIRNFTKQALDRAEKRMALYEKYDGKPPKEKMENFDKETETLNDAFIDYKIDAKEANNPDLPSPKEFKGKTITSPTGEKFTSDGLRWTVKE
jgi:hypothetical protein